MEKRGLFLFHTLFIWVMYFLMSYVLFKAIPAVSALGLTDAVLVMVAGGFGMVLPAPGGIGSYHWQSPLALRPSDSPVTWDLPWPMWFG